jgi:hypothetical protein
MLLIFVSNVHVDGDGLACQRIEQAQVGVNQRAIERLELDVLEPGESLAREKISLGSGDESARQHRVNAVANAGTLVDKGRSPS